MLFEGQLKQQDALMLLDSRASANFILKKALDMGKLTLNPTEATLELADGSSSPVLGTAEVTLRMYRLSPSELIEVKRQVTELLHKQLIEPSVSPYGAPLLFVL